MGILEIVLALFAGVILPLWGWIAFMTYQNSVNIRVLQTQFGNFQQNVVTRIEKLEEEDKKKAWIRGYKEGKA